MNKAELIEVVAARIDASKKDAGEAVQAVVDAITEAVAKGQKVSISGFGVFERAARPARTYRTPSTGEAIQKLATSVPKFRPGGDFRAFVSGEKNISDLTRTAENVLRRVTGQGGEEETEAPAAAPAPTAAAPAAAPAKKAPAKRASTAKKASTAKRTTTRKSTAAKKATAATGSSASEAPAKKTTTRKSTSTAKKAPAKRAPRKTAAAAEKPAEESASS